MRRIKVFLILILLILITGCSNYDMTMKISKDKRVDYSLTILSNSNDFNEEITSYKEKFEQYGYLVEEYKSDNKYGMIVSKKFDNIDNISNGKRSEEFNLLYLYSDGYDETIESKMFNVEKGIDTNRYAANLYVDLSNLGIDLNKATVTYTVMLPNVSVSNNANSITNEGKTLTWNITSSGKTEIDYVFELKSYDSLYFGAAVIIAIFLFFMIISTLFSKSGDSNSNASDDYDLDKKIQNLTNNAIKNNNYINTNNYNNRPNNNNYNNTNNINNRTNNNYNNANNMNYNNANNMNYNNVNNMNYNNSKPINNNYQYNNQVNNNTQESSINPKNETSQINLVPQVKSNDDLSGLKTPEKRKKKGLIGIFNKEKKKNTTTNPVKVNTNEEFDAMIENINKGSINVNSKSIDTIEQEDTKDIENQIETTFSNDNNLDINNINDFDSFDIIGKQDNASNINNSTSSLENSNLSNVNEENNLDSPTIRVNSKSISINNNKEEE